MSLYINLTAQNIIELNGATALCVSAGLDFEEIIIHWFTKAEINFNIQEVLVQYCDYRHWHDSPWNFSYTLPKEAIIKPQMTLTTLLSMWHLEVPSLVGTKPSLFFQC